MCLENDGKMHITVREVRGGQRAAGMVLGTWQVPSPVHNSTGSPVVGVRTCSRMH